MSANPQEPDEDLLLVAAQVVQGLQGHCRKHGWELQVEELELPVSDPYVSFPPAGVAVTRRVKAGLMRLKGDGW